MTNQPKFQWSTGKVIALSLFAACVAFYGASKSALFNGPKPHAAPSANTPVLPLESSSEGQPEKAADEFTYVRVTDVFEGDVIGLADGTEINLIGVTCPKSDETDPSRLAIAREAFAFTTGAVLGKDVRLEYEPAHPADSTGRTLAYVFLRDGSLLNAELIKQGYGNAFTRYAYRFSDDFRRYELSAKNGKIGLWEDREPLETIGDNTYNDSADTSSSTTADSTTSSENLNTFTRPRSAETAPQSVESRTNVYRPTYEQPENYSPLTQRSYTVPLIESPVTPRVAENGSYYGEISERTGRPKTVYVQGYTRRDGTYVRSHFRSTPRR